MLKYLIENVMVMHGTYISFVSFTIIHNANTMQMLCKWVFAVFRG